LFHTLYEQLQNEIEVRTFELPFLSTGLRKRLLNTWSLLQFSRCIVHITGDSYYAILGALFSKRVITIHDLSFLARTRGMKRRLLKLFWVTLPVHFSHAITVVSQATKQVLLKETTLRPGKIEVVGNFIDPIYQPVKRSFNAGLPRILQVGTDFNKNIENLAAALEGVPCLVVIIGKLSEKQKLLLNQLGINYRNYYALSLSELHNEYVLADLLSFVSTIEGFGMPILEAQATGLPVITSNCSSMPEVAGEGAVLVDPFNVESIREGIKTIIQNDNVRDQIITAGYRNVKQFSKETVASRYLKIYRQL
jgi:glycosyltransferase involved in cell wall biosynthesis